MSDFVEIIFPLYRLTISGALYDSVVYLSVEGKKSFKSANTKNCKSKVQQKKPDCGIIPTT